jgi:hypothetical protein
MSWDTEHDHPSVTICAGACIAGWEFGRLRRSSAGWECPTQTRCREPANPCRCRRLRSWLHESGPGAAGVVLSRRDALARQCANKSMGGPASLRDRDPRSAPLRASQGNAVRSRKARRLALDKDTLARCGGTQRVLRFGRGSDAASPCQAGLNKSEQRRALTQVIYTFKQGRIADRGQDAQQFRASGLSLSRSLPSGRRFSEWEDSVGPDHPAGV